MKKSIKIILIFFTTVSFSQEFPVPKNVKLNNINDYKKTEDAALMCINWLENTRIKNQGKKRKEVMGFVQKWIIGTPYLNINLQPYQVELTLKNPDLLINFMGGWVKYTLKHPKDTECSVNANLAGIESVLNVYKANKGKGIKKDKKIEILLTMNNLELKKWVKSEKVQGKEERIIKKQVKSKIVQTIEKRIISKQIIKN